MKLDITEDEIRAFCIVANRIGGDPKTSYRKDLDSLYEKVCSLLSPEDRIKNTHYSFREHLHLKNGALYFKETEQ